MADNTEFNKIVKKLNERHLFCKTFYDSYWGNQLYIGQNDVYLKKEVDKILKELKELFDKQQDEFLKNKKRANDLELENYKLKRRKKDDSTN